MNNPDYLALRLKVQEKTQEIEQRNTSSIVCKKGCSGCCRSGLSVSPIEFDFISSFLVERPETLKEALEAESDLRKSPGSCGFLTLSGSCSIYEVRPIICMSHGIPIQAKVDEQILKSVCPLNFKEGLDHIDSSNFINLDLINSILSLINARDYEKSAERKSLTPSQFLHREFK